MPGTTRTTRTRKASTGTTPLAANSLPVEAIARQIAEAIIARRLPPGTWLREEALGRVYAVSRTKVHAALVMLSKDRLVENIPDKGYFVCQPSVQEAREVFGVRRLLEAEVVRLLVSRASHRDYELLAQHIAAERQTLASPGARPASGAAREKLLGDFHVVLAETAGNHTVAELVREMVARSSLIAMLYHTSNDPQCSSHEHEDLLHLCRQGDAETAVRCMDAHLRRIEANLQFQAAPQPPRDIVNALLA